MMQRTLQVRQNHEAVGHHIEQRMFISKSKEAVIRPVITDKRGNVLVILPAIKEGE